MKSISGVYKNVWNRYFYTPTHAPRPLCYPAFNSPRALIKVRPGSRPGWILSCWTACLRWTVNNNRTGERRDTRTMEMRPVKDQPLLQQRLMLQVRSVLFFYTLSLFFVMQIILFHVCIVTIVIILITVSAHRHSHLMVLCAQEH